jgi:hypothetical protein
MFMRFKQERVSNRIFPLLELPSLILTVTAPNIPTEQPASSLRAKRS